MRKPHEPASIRHLGFHSPSMLEMEMSLQRGQHLQMVVHTADLRNWWIISGGVWLYSVPRERAYTPSLDYLTHCWQKWEVSAAQVGIYAEELGKGEAAFKAFLEMVIWEMDKLNKLPKFILWLLAEPEAEHTVLKCALFTRLGRCLFSVFIVRISGWPCQR